MAAKAQVSLPSSAVALKAAPEKQGNHLLGRDQPWKSCCCPRTHTLCISFATGNCAPGTGEPFGGRGMSAQTRAHRATGHEPELPQGWRVLQLQGSEAHKGSRVPGEGAACGWEGQAGCVGKGKYGGAAGALGEAQGSFSLPDAFPSSPPQPPARSFQKLWEVHGRT